jgi:hypothetical protein
VNDRQSALLLVELAKSHGIDFQEAARPCYRGCGEMGVCHTDFRPAMKQVLALARSNADGDAR